MKFRNNIAVLMAGLLTISGGVFVACDEDDDLNTEQIQGGISLVAAQLQVTRGGYMIFKGSGLGAIKEIQFPGGVSAQPEVVDGITIRCQVPMGAMPGQVKLVYDGGEILTKEIAFTEPIEFQELSATTMKAGDNVTVKGSYLNHIEYVRFETGDTVVITPSEKPAFEFSFIVPKDASSGELVMGYYLTAEDVNEISCGKVTVAGPEITVAELKDVMPEQVISIKGANLELVQSVVFPDGEATDKFELKEGVITVKAYAEMPAGTIKVLAFSGLEYDAVNVEPKAATIKAAFTGKNGSKVEGIECTDIELIKEVVFPTVDEKKTTSSAAEVKDGKLNITIPADAISGDATVVAKSGAKSTVAFTTVKPLCIDDKGGYVGPWPQIAGGQVVFGGTDLDLIAKIILPSGEEIVGEASADGSTYTVVFPITAHSANNAIAVMTNGEQNEKLHWLDIIAPEYCYVANVEAEYQSAQTAEFAAANIDKLTQVLLNGKEAQYMTHGDNLIIYIPSECAGQKLKVTLVSGEIGVQDFNVKVAAVGLVETFVWEGIVELSGWKGVWQADNGVGECKFPLPLPDGAKIRIHFDKSKTEVGINFLDGYWGQGPAWSYKDAPNTISIPKDQFLAGDDYYELDVPNFIDWDGCVMIQDQGGAVVITGVSYVVDYGGVSAEKEILPAEGNFGDKIAWKLPCALSWSDDSGKFALLRKDAGDALKVGAKIRFYVEGAGQIQINSVDWQQKIDITNPDNLDVLVLDVTEDVMKILEVSVGWSDAFAVCQGDAMTVTKVTIE